MDKQRPGSLAVFDVNGDTLKDVVTLNTDARSMTVWKNDGTGHSTVRVRFRRAVRSRGDALRPISTATATVTSPCPSSRASDPAARTRRSSAATASAASGEARSSRRPAPRARTRTSSRRSTTCATLIPDLVVTYGTDQYMWRGNGDGTFQAPTALGWAGEVRVGDASGSPSPDFVAADRLNSRVLIEEGDGNGAFTLRQTITDIFGTATTSSRTSSRARRPTSSSPARRSSASRGIYVIRYDDPTSSYVAPVFTKLSDIGLRRVHGLLATGRRATSTQTATSTWPR